ncbi:juvenile hormone acid O-methyltransferase-like isoform X3 [Anneissia japonica]|uniref:juvenile hormone acid O-methyltransferase-like isoform X3 n=1 Tax=Anneissia japonica TaxID=1529436 RepID=UPI0014259A78|nr:juvenile hormone acid O-methyltransferase-like isoform X3 [Anneissia japonica]
MNSKESELYSKSRRIHKISMEVFAPKFNFAKTDSVLDVGCGSGDLTSQIGELANSVVGLDISKDMITFANQNNRPKNVEYICCDAQDFGGNASSWRNKFDKAVSLFALHWVENRKMAIRNIHSCLKEGGEAFIIVNGPMQKTLGNKPDELPFYLKNHMKWKMILQNYEHGMHNDLDLSQWTRLLEEEGFEMLRGEMKEPFEERTLPDDNELKGYLKTLMGQFSYVPEQFHAELLTDAFEWCKKELPFNKQGIQYFAANVIFIHAKKKPAHRD